MESLYWISVIGNVGTTLTVFGVLLLLCGFICFIVAMTSYNEVACDLQCYSGPDKEDIEACIKFPKAYKWFLPIGFIIFLASMFLPSKSDMYMIYGAGSVIEYVKSSDEAKQIPENALKAINNWLENNNKQ